MNGPDHYRAAEALLEQADRMRATVTPNTIDVGAAAVAAYATLAQAHATLALAAATVVYVPDGGWLQVTQ